MAKVLFLINLGQFTRYKEVDVVPPVGMRVAVEPNHFGRVESVIYNLYKDGWEVNISFEDTSTLSDDWYDWDAAVLDACFSSREQL
jgi:hypothetical protein